MCSQIFLPHHTVLSSLSVCMPILFLAVQQGGLGQSSPSLHHLDMGMKVNIEAVVRHHCLILSLA